MEFTLNVFVLAMALICPSENRVMVTDIIIPHTLTLEKCTLLEGNETMQNIFIPDLEDENCHAQFICVNVSWE